MGLFRGLFNDRRPKQPRQPMRHEPSDVPEGYQYSLGVLPGGSGPVPKGYEYTMGVLPGNKK